MATTLTFIQGTNFGSSGSSTPSISVNIGTAAADRIVVAAIMATMSGNSLAPTSVTLGGNAMTPAIVSNHADLGANGNLAAIYWLAVPSGTTATLQVNHGGAVFDTEGTIWSLTGADTTTPVKDTASAFSNSNGGETFTLDVDTSAGGSVAACTKSYQFVAASATDFTWNNLTKDYEIFPFGVHVVSAASASNVSAATPGAYSITFNSTASGTLKNAVSASFQAPTGGSPFTLDADSAAYAWSATASGLDVGMPSDSAAYVWAPSDATLQYGALTSYILNADSRAYLWSASEASLEYSGAFHGGGAGSGGQARSRAGGFWRAGKFIPYEDVAPPDIKSPEPALLSEPEPAPDNPPIIRSDTKQRSVVGPGSFADIGRTSPKVKVPPNLTRPKPGRSDTRKNAPPILGEVKALTPPSLEDRVAKAIEAGMAKALTARAEADKPSAEELAQAEEDRELKLLKQLGFLAND